MREGERGVRKEKGCEKERERELREIRSGVLTEIAMSRAIIRLMDQTDLRKNLFSGEKFLVSFPQWWTKFFYWTFKICLGISKFNTRMLAVTEKT